VQQGTILLDEIGEMSPMLQAKLLHVLQDDNSPAGRTLQHIRRFPGVSGHEYRCTDVHRQQTFREDLYYRLNAFTMTIPPLRERREEIPLLFKHFMNQFCEKYAHPSMRYQSSWLMPACNITGLEICASWAISSRDSLCFRMKAWRFPN